MKKRLHFNIFQQAMRDKMNDTSYATENAS